MKLTLDEMREIAKRLPIGYYLGRNTPVIVEEGYHAFANVVNGDIHIGIGLLQSAADHINPSDVGKWDRETLLRCLLYHEIGHLLLTHKGLGYLDLINSSTKRYRLNKHALINIFEDERIETLLSNVFHGVNFKDFCRLVNGDKVEHSSEENKFLDAVRLRNTTKEINAKIDKAIKSLANINANQISDDDTKNYEKYVSELADLILNEDEKKEDEQSDKSQNDESQSDESQSDEQQTDEGQNNKGQSDKNNNQDKEQDDASDSDESKDEEEERDDGDGGSNNIGSEKSEKKEDEEKVDEGEEQSTGGQFVGGIELLRAAAEKVFVQPPQDVTRVLNRFASRLAKKRGTQAAGCWSGLHGKIEAKRDAMDKDKIFRRKSDVGDKLLSTVNLTLWVDNSNSFHGSKDQLNQILSAVSKAVGMAGDKLNVNLITMDWYASIIPQEQWFVNPAGGNYINKSYINAWEKTRKKDRRNIDIVVFDGLCCNTASLLNAYPDYENLTKEQKQSISKTFGRGYFKHELPLELQVPEKIWNSHDCWIVSDTTNKEYFSKTVPKAHVTYIASDYAKHLQSRVIEILDRIL